MTQRIILLAMILTLILAAPVQAAESDNGTIQVLVVNKTENGSSTDGQEINLRTYQDGAEIATTVGTTDAEGQFTYEGVSTEPGYSYQVTLYYQDAEYSSEPVSFSENETTTSIEVVVYDATTSDEAIRVDTAHTILYLEGDTLWVTEYFLFVNDSDLTYIGSPEVNAEGKRETLWFPVPRKATELQPGFGLMECCIYATDDGLIDTMPVLPGSKEISYYYRTSYDSGEYILNQRVNYPIGTFSLLVQDAGITVAGDRLTADETVDLEGTPFQHYTVSDLKPGDTLYAQLSGLPINSPPPILWAGLTLAVLAAGASIGFLLRRNKLQPVKAEGSLNQRRRSLLSELARLDDDFEDGKISDAAYNKQRTAKKAELVRLIEGAKGKKGDR